MSRCQSCRFRVVFKSAKGAMLNICMGEEAEDDMYLEVSNFDSSQYILYAGNDDTHPAPTADIERLITDLLEAHDEKRVSGHSCFTDEVRQAAAKQFDEAKQALLDRVGGK